MSQPDWQALQEAFEKVLSQPKSEQQSYLHTNYQDDVELFNALLKLLRADAENAAAKSDPYSIKLESIDKQLIGSSIDGWEIQKLIGTGGMGSVFLAEKKSGGYRQLVALKVIKKGMDSETVINRFRQERKILASLNHPNIARLIDGGITNDGRPYFAMELVKGLPINQYCDTNKLTISQRLELFQKACKAVHYAHKNLIVHRDLKPSNIIVTDEGELKLLDFGIAKLLDESSDNQFTRTGMQLHTPAYASPEQLISDSITTSVDIYALGILLYEILSGKRPYEMKRSQKEFIELVLAGEPVKPSEAIMEETLLANPETTKTLEEISNDRGEQTVGLRRTLSGDLDTICLMAMHRESERRYSSANELSEDISRHLNGLPVFAQTDSFYYRLQKLIKRNIPSTVISIIAIISIVTLSVFYTVQLAKQRDAAVVEREKAEKVVEFVTDLFKISDPEQSKGEKITARDILDAGAIQIKTELTDQPEVQLMMRRVLGEVYYNLGLETRAREILTQTLEEQKKLLGDLHLDVAITKILLGFIHQDRGKYELAEPLFLEAFKVQKLLLNDDHFLLVESLNILGAFHQQKGDYSQAESLFESALRMVKRLTNEDNEYLAETLKNLASVKRILDRNEEAEPLLRNALDMQLRIYKDGSHPKIDDTKRELAGLLRNTRRFDEAKMLYLEIIDSRTKMLGNDHLEVAHVWNSYSQLLSDMHDYQGALDANKTFLDITLRAYSGSHPSLAAAYNNRALLLKYNNLFDEAIEHFNLSIEMQDAIELPKRHANRSYPLAGKADIYLEKKNHLKAKIAYTEVLSLLRESFSEQHILVTDAKSNLAASMIGLKEFDQAEPLLMACYQQFLDTRSPDDPRTERAAHRLLHLYKEKGDLVKAQKLEQQLKTDGVNL